MPEELGTVQKRGMSKGCLIGLVIIGILAVLILVLGTLTYFYWEDIANWGLEKTTEMIAMEIKANLPAEYSEQDVDELFDRLTRALKNKEIDASSIQKLATQFQLYLEDQKIDVDEAREIIEEIKRTVEY